jgi:hypothetical protein
MPPSLHKVSDVIDCIKGKQRPVTLTFSRARNAAAVAVDGGAGGRRIRISSSSAVFPPSLLRNVISYNQIATILNTCYRKYS